MGRRRKKYKKVVRRRRRIPTVFQCPACGSRNLTIKFERGSYSGEEVGGTPKKVAVIRCGNCGLCYRMVVPSIYEAVDVYNKFVDLYMENKMEQLEPCTSSDKSGEEVVESE